MNQLIIEAIKNPRKALFVLKFRVDTHIGKLLFKNTAGFLNNIRGIRTKNKFKKSQLKFKISNKFSEELKLNGHVLLGQICNDSLIEKLSNELNKIVEDETLSSVRSQHNGKVYSRSVHELILKIPDVKKLMSEKIIDLFQQYYGSYFQILDVQGFRNYHIPDEINKKHHLYSDEWHCDGHDITFTKLFVYLTDVSEDDGPFFTHSIQSTKELIKKGFGSRTNYKLSKEIIEDPKYATKYTGSKGTSLAGNLNVCFHRATVPIQGHYRDLMQFFIAPSTTPLPTNWPQELEKKYKNNDSEHDDLTIT